MSFASASEVEGTFYEAFRRGDYEQMMQVWARTDDVYCIHPMGPSLIGRQLVARSWQQILSGAFDRRFEIQLNASWVEATMAVHFVNELISDPNTGQVFSPVFATNVYRQLEDGWYMISHHASLDASSGASESLPETRH